MEKTLRYYQKECLDIIHNIDPGSYLIQMCCGAGKTFTFSKIKRQGRVLLLAHRQELIFQPAEEYDCPIGIEMAKYSSNGEEVVIASTSTLVNRLDKFPKDYFDIIIYDEAQHAPAKNNKKILEHFDPRLLLGFTATPNRADGKGLDEIFDDIIFEYPIEQAMKDGNLCPIECKRVTLDFDLNGIKKSGDDFNKNDLFERMKGTEHGIAEAYNKFRRNKTMIFGVNVEHCEEISKLIPNSKIVHAGTKDRKEIVKEFEHGSLDCIVNCMIFTEGTNIPCIETVIWARPTQSEALYTQGVMRGARLFPGKDKMLLIDCVDASAKNSLCTAPTLIGIDVDQLDKKKQDTLEGDLFGLPDTIESLADTPKQWIMNVKNFDLWKRKKKYKTHGVNYFKFPDGRMKVSLSKKEHIEISTPDSLERVYIKTSKGWTSERMNIQRAFDKVHNILKEHKAGAEPIWNVAIAKKWGKKKATPKQMQIIKAKYPGCRYLTRLEASQILNRIM